MEVCARLVRVFSAVFLIPPTDQGDQHEQQPIRTSAYLLKELSLLKKLDSGYEAGSKTGNERTAHQLRQERHREITEEIKALAEQKKNDEQS
jgi:hypothetical protein